MSELNNAVKQRNKYLIPQNTKDREKQLEEMIQLAWVDGTFAPAEKELIKMVGEKLGFSAVEVERYIEIQKTS